MTCPNKHKAATAFCIAAATGPETHNSSEFECVNPCLLQLATTLFATRTVRALALPVVHAMLGMALKRKSIEEELQ